MDNTAISAEMKNTLYDELYKVIIDSMADGIILEDEAGNSADFILSTLEQVSNQTELIDFLFRLSQRWDIFVGIFQKYKSNQLLEKVHQEINSLTTQ